MAFGKRTIDLIIHFRHCHTSIRRITSNMYRHHTTTVYSSVYSARPIKHVSRACVRTRAINVNDLLILVDGSNVFTVLYYIPIPVGIFLLEYVFALCRSRHRKKRRKSYGRVIQFEFDRKRSSGLVDGAYWGTEGLPWVEAAVRRFCRRRRFAKCTKHRHTYINVNEFT